MRSEKAPSAHRRCDKIRTVIVTTLFAGREEGIALADRLKAFGIWLFGGEGEGDAAPKVGWRCTICGHIEYVDELPDDFECPICGVGKEMFERVEL